MSAMFNEAVSDMLDGAGTVEAEAQGSIAKEELAVVWQAKPNRAQSHDAEGGQVTRDTTRTTRNRALSQPAANSPRGDADASCRIGLSKGHGRHHPPLCFGLGEPICRLRSVGEYLVVAIETTTTAAAGGTRRGLSVSFGFSEGGMC